MNTLPLTDCQKQIREVMEHLRRVLDREIADGERETWEADICLATRSAYFDFYTCAVIDGEVDKPAEDDLDQLFRQSLRLMRASQYKHSVENRYREFKDLCEQARDGVLSAASL